MVETTAPNLFAAARGYMVAMSKLLPEFQQGAASAVAMAFYLLAGFSLELSLKAILLRQTGDHSLLRKIGHDLNKAFAAAVECGLIVDDEGVFACLIERMSSVHKGHVARYVPNVEVINLPGPGLVYNLIVSHLNRAESQFDVWCDNEIAG